LDWHATCGIVFQLGALYYVSLYFVVRCREGGKEKEEEQKRIETIIWFWIAKVRSNVDLAVFYFLLFISNRLLVFSAL